MASNIVIEISRHDLQELRTLSSAVINNVKHLSSYNWMEESKPTIIVPGSPALWSPPMGPRKLKKDQGTVFIAQNAARHPNSPLEPLFRALYLEHPSFDIHAIDVITDRNNLRKLLSFVSGRSETGDDLESFAINIEVIENTVILSRTETKTQEVIEPNEFRGFGHEFEKAYTVNKIKGSTGHHRIISYCFGGLNFIVRHKTDGYVDNGTSIQTSSGGRIQNVDNLSDALGSLSLSSTNNKAGLAPVSSSNLIVKEGGQVVPLESIVELKTRTFSKPIAFNDIAPQLWASQTLNLVRAYHRNGLFQRPQLENAKDLIKSWEASNQVNLKKLAWLIENLTTAVRDRGKTMVLIYDPLRDKLVIRQVERENMFPDDLYLKWKEKKQPEAGIDTNIEAKIDALQKDQVLESRKPISPLTAIKIGDVVYNIDISKIPYFASFVKNQEATQQGKSELVHDQIPLFDVALKGLMSGYRQCFRLLPANLSQHSTLCETYKFLNVDVLSNASLDNIIANLKVGKADYDVDYGERPIRGNKELARNTAFQLLYLLLHGELEDHTKDVQKLYNAVMFVVSHPGTFKYKTKRVVRAAYEMRFSITLNQRLRLNEWEQKGGGIDEDDATTEEEPIYDYYDSDAAFDWYDSDRS